MVDKSEVVEEGKEEDKWVSRREGAWRKGSETSSHLLAGKKRWEITVVTLGLLGQLGLVHLVLPVAHLDNDLEAPLPRPVQPLLLLRHPLRRSMIGCSIT